MIRVPCTLLLVMLAARAHRDGGTGADFVISKPTGRLAELERLWSVVERPDGRVVIPQSWAVIGTELNGSVFDMLGQIGKGPGDVSPDGKCSSGVPRPFEPIPVTKADQRKMYSFSGLPSSSVLDTMYEPMADTKRAFAEAVAALDGQVGTRPHKPGRAFMRTLRDFSGEQAADGFASARPHPGGRHGAAPVRDSQG